MNQRFVSYRTDTLSSYRTELIAAFGSVGGNVAMFQSRQSREQRAEESRRSKRSAQQDTERHTDKRAKTEYVPMIPSASSTNILANYDITQIPLSAIVNLCMTVLQTVPLEVMSERVALLPTEGVTLAVTRTGFVRSSTPPYPPPPDQPQFNTNPLFKKEHEELDMPDIKMENTIDSDEEMENNFKSAPVPLPIVPIKQEQKPKVPVLASVEERASQALKMQPYELAEQRDLNESEKKQLLKMAIKRILYAEKSFQLNMITSDASTPITAKSRWLLLVAKLVTRGISMRSSPSPDEEEDTKVVPMDIDDTNDLKDLLLDFIVEDLLSR